MKTTGLYYYVWPEGTPIAKGLLVLMIITVVWLLASYVLSKLIDKMER